MSNNSFVSKPEIQTISERIESMLYTTKKDKNEV